MPTLPTAPTLTRRGAVRLGSGGLAVALAAGGLGASAAEDISTLEANKAIVHRLYEEAFNGGNLAAIEEVYAPDYVDRGTWARQMPGPAGMPLTIAQFHTMFPDMTVAVDAAIAEVDLVATIATWRGTHPPAGTHVMGRTMHVFRIANGQIVEQWSVGWDWIDDLRGRSAPRPANPLLGS